MMQPFIFIFFLLPLPQGWPLNSPTSTFGRAGIIAVSHHAQLGDMFLKDKIEEQYFALKVFCPCKIIPWF
jgi:hypothetical protein